MSVVDVLSNAQTGIESLRAKVGALGAILGSNTIAAVGGSPTSPTSPATAAQSSNRSPLGNVLKASLPMELMLGAGAVILVGALYFFSRRR